MIIETHHVAKRFGRFEAIEDLSLSVPEGSVFALIGPNGAGKTTTIRMLMNILRPDRGDITVLGTPSQPARAEGFPAHRLRLGEPEAARRAHARAVLRLPAQASIPPGTAASRQELCAQFELPPSRKIKHLSHGMRMKIAAGRRARLPPQTTGAG